MDLFRFTNPHAKSRMEQGRLIENADSKMWVERYRDAGEFQVVAKVDTDIRSSLPIGSFVSHTDSDEMMIVENHEINDDGDSIPDVTITGRGMESFLEQRAVGSNRSFPTSGAIPDYKIPAAKSWAQAALLVRNHIDAALLVDDNNALPYFETVSIAAGYGDSEERPIKRGDLYSALLEVLAVDDLGIKVLRPGRTGGLAARPEDSVIVIHQGRDRSASVLFSYDSGDVASADYLWSNKGAKDSAYCYGKWVDTVVHFGPYTSGFGRRWMSIDMSDLDQQFSESPDADIRTVIRTAMEIRGKQILSNQFFVALTKAELSKDAQSAVYREDYEVGDFVSVAGNYNTETVMRVVEHVEIEDGEGYHSYPTLSASE